MTVFVADVAAGLPVVLLLHLLGGIDLRLILLAYAGLITTAFFMIALAIWVSTNASDLRQAGGASVLWMIAWLGGPFFVSMVFPRFGIRLPGFLLTANAWVMASSPLGLALKIGGGVTPSSGLLDAVAWMSGLQVAGGALLVIGSIARLRSAYRLNVSGDSQSLAARLTRPGWRLRPRPPVGDDPILWREMTTSRAGLLGKAVGLVISLGIYGTLGYVTYFFGRPALIEVWHHGYRSGITSAERPEWNILIRFFMSGPDVNPPVDVARTEFNVFLRYLTTPIVFLVTMIAAGNAAEGIVSERARETWDSLIATPLSARDILRSKMLAALWRMRVDPGDAARPLDDRPVRGGRPSRRLSRLGPHRGRLDLVHADVRVVDRRGRERPWRHDRIKPGPPLPLDRRGRPAVPAADTMETRCSWAPARPRSSRGCRSCPTATCATPGISRSTPPCNGCTSIPARDRSGSPRPA